MSIKRVGLIALAAMMVAGCCSPGVGRFDIQATAGEAIRDQSVEVHLVAVSQSDYQTWYNYSLDDYWAPSDARREAAVASGHAQVLRFGQGYPASHLLAAKDPVFKKWKDQGAWHLFILADLPWIRGAKPGAADPRRRILPLNKCRWKKREIRFTVTRGGIDVETQPKPEKE